MRNTPASISVLVGLLGVAVLPAAVAYADWSGRFELIWSGLAVPVALVLGLAAIGLARRGERRARLLLSGRSGSARVLFGRVLGTVAALLAGAGATALVVYAILTWRGRS